MASLKETELEKYEISDCYIRSDVIIGFVGQLITENEPYTTRIFYHYLDDKTWGYVPLDETYGVVGCECHIPSERWIFANVEGGIYVGGGGDSGFEKALPISEKARITALRCIHQGKAYAVSSMRNVYRRDDISQWEDLSVPLTEIDQKKLGDIGFTAIDGFSDIDIYACGSNSDAWHYNGKTWTMIDLPSNTLITDMVCGDDGNVYITLWDGVILIGRNNHWERIEQNLTEQLEAVRWYKDRAYIATSSRLYQLKNNTFSEVPFENGYKQLFCGFLSAGYGYLISSGPKEAHIFDGQEWKTVFNFNSSE